MAAPSSLGTAAPLDTGPGGEIIKLGGKHFPTGGRITLADIVRLLITEFGVAPRLADWDAVLDANRDPFDLAG